MGSPNRYSRWKANWDSIVAAVQAEMATGHSLQAVQVLTRSEQPTTELAPYIGVQYKSSRWEIIGQGARRETATFAVVCFVVQGYSDTVPDTASAALAQLQPLVNDGAGGGLEPLLMGLSVASLLTQVTTLEMDVIPGDAVTSQAIAYARFELTTVDQVRSF